MFDNMTPQEAASEITRMNAWSKPGGYDLVASIAAALQHFYERGLADQRAAIMPMVNDLQSMLAEQRKRWENADGR